MDQASESALVRRLHDLVAPIVADLGLDLYDLEFGAGLLKITVDTPPGSPGGVDVDSLSQCTRLVSRELDHSDPIPGHYTLEVTSPGLERTLRTPHHFRREVGKTVNVRLRDVSNESRRVSGVLVSADDQGVVLLTDSGEQTIEYVRIDRARTVFVWEAAPKPGGKGRSSASKKGRATADSSSGKPRSQSKKTGDKS
jgi:ribosome maturation factor RimP